MLGLSLAPLRLSDQLGRPRLLFDFFLELFIFFKIKALFIHCSLFSQECALNQVLNLGRLVLPVGGGLLVLDTVRAWPDSWLSLFVASS